MEVVRMARIVPIGMERWASFKSPERLEPAMIPEQTQKNIKKLTSYGCVSICNVVPKWFSCTYQ